MNAQPYPALMQFLRPLKAFLLFFLIYQCSICSAIGQNFQPRLAPGKSTVIKYNDPTGVIDGYNIYLPVNYKAKGKQYPILVFLQGGLGVGGAIADINQWGLPRLISEESDLSTERNQYLLDSFIVVSPHMTEGDFSERQFYNQEAAFRNIIKQVLGFCNADRSRVYLTGLSRGGHGTWGLASKMNDVFAAVVPICGGLHGVADFEALTEIPIWTVHNTGDNLVGYGETEKAVRKIEQLSGQEFLVITTLDPKEEAYLQHDKIFSSLDREGHDAWTDTYNRVYIYKWLLKHHR